MTCNEIGGRLLDLAGGATLDAETNKHLQTCDACAEKLAVVMQTMAMMDEWKSPEPSPYFESRLRARLREERVTPARSWLDWLRKPALVAAMGALLVTGITLYKDYGAVGSAHHAQIVDVKPGSAVADLNTLDSNHDLLANFDLLDDLDNGDVGSQAVNP